MASVYICTVSSVDYEAGTADLSIDELEGLQKPGVPFLSFMYEMPKAGDAVAAIFEGSGGRLERGIVLGGIYSADSRPKAPGRGVFSKVFEDGAYVKYSSGVMEVSAPEVRVKKLLADEIIYRVGLQKEG